MASTSTVHPVAIIGGGPVGLSASILLSLRKIPHVLFERHGGTSIHPKACGINQRTTEIFRAMGIYDAVRAVAAPDEIKGRTAWYTSLGGQGHGLDGWEIWSRDAWGGGQYAEEYERHGPTRYEILPQIRLEPVLLRRARELCPEGLRFRQEVTDLRERDGCVALRVKDGETGEEEEVLARFVIAADGGRSITDKLGVKWLGEQDIMEMVSVHFRAPIRSRHPDPRNFMTWFTHPEAGGSIKTGYLYQIGPWPFDSPAAKESEEWVFACARTPSDPERFDEDAIVTRLRNTLKLRDLPVEVISLSHWNVQAISAERYRVGRVFLAGDAAHKIPPWGALGMNTGIQDVQNLVWKLGLALRDEDKFDRLLDSYDTERRPIGRSVGQSSLHNLRSHGLVVDAALGVGPDKSPQANSAAMAAFFDKTHPEHVERWKAVEDAQKIMDLEFKAPGYEIGWFYPDRGPDEAADKGHGGQLSSDGSFKSDVFCPSTIPGHHLPHVWISKCGQIVAIRDLVRLDKLLLLASNEMWMSKASDWVDVKQIGTSEGWQDPSGDWERFQEGCDAALVRPDGMISWRGKWDESMAAGWPRVLEQTLWLEEVP